MSRRTERIGALIRSLLAEAIQHRLNDPRIPPITSITRVEVSEDLAIARVHVSVLAAEAQRRLCVDALGSAAGHLRRMIGRQLTLRKVPLLEFRLDESLRRSFETVQTIDRVMRELGEVPEWERAAPADPDAAGQGGPGAAPAGPPPTEQSPPTPPRGAADRKDG